MFTLHKKTMKVIAQLTMVYFGIFINFESLKMSRFVRDL